jgi:hypothetical protein
MQLPFVFRLALTLMLFLGAGLVSVRPQPTAQAPLLKTAEDEVEVSTFYQGEFDRPTYSLWGPRPAARQMSIADLELLRQGGSSRRRLPVEQAAVSRADAQKSHSGPPSRIGRTSPKLARIGIRAKLN